MSKIAVFFPGVGYTADKPLLHYSRRLAEDQGYEIKFLPYAGFPEKIKGDRAKMVESFNLALQQTEEMLSEVDLTAYDDVLFVGKSVGTIVAAKIAAESPMAEKIRLVLYTPLEDTFTFLKDKAKCIMFTGAADPWVGGASSRISGLCAERKIPCHVIPEADHSLESGNLYKDLQNMQQIMEATEAFMTGRTGY